MHFRGIVGFAAEAKRNSCPSDRTKKGRSVKERPFVMHCQPVQILTFMMILCISAFEIMGMCASSGK
jgi:hypothetical protein